MLYQRLGNSAAHSAVDIVVFGGDDAARLLGGGDDGSTSMGLMEEQLTTSADTPFSASMFAASSARGTISPQAMR